MRNPAKVWFYSGHTHAERPRSFLWNDQMIDVESIEKAWQEPGEKHFRVRAGEDKPFQICYHELQDEWTVIELIQQQP